MRILVIQTNDDGRPCGWGMVNASVPGAECLAREEAERQYAAHCCYSGERRGAVKVRQLEENDEAL